MGQNAFIGRNEEPTEEELAVALGPAKTVWDRLLACGHFKWWTSHANDEVTAARSIGYLVPGWTMLAMGYVGLRAGRGGNRKGDGV